MSSSEPNLIGSIKTENDIDNSSQFQIRPPIEKRFSKDIAKEIIHEVLSKELSDKKYNKDEMEALMKSILAIIKEKFRAIVDPNYKLVIHLTLGEQRGAGIKSAARCIWDSATDAAASLPYENESLFCVATVFAVYFY